MFASRIVKAAAGVGMASLFFSSPAAADVSRYLTECLPGYTKIQIPGDLSATYTTWGCLDVKRGFVYALPFAQVATRDLRAQMAEIEQKDAERSRMIEDISGEVEKRTEQQLKDRPPLQINVPPPKVIAPYPLYVPPRVRRP